MTERENYHKIFIPAPDVYVLGGTELFKHLERNEENEKNLVIVPSAFVNILGEKTKHASYSAGAEDVLRFFKTIIKQGKVNRIANKEIKTTCNFLEGLDIAFIPSTGSKGIKLQEDLAARVKKYWSAHSEKSILLTNDPANHILSHGRGIEIQDPHFLQVNEDIVNEGIIDGTDELYAAIQQKEELPLEEVTEMLDRELYINQFIRFRTERDYQYARVFAKLEKNPSGSRITGIKNEKVKLLNAKEYNKNIYVGRQFMQDVLGIKPRDMEQYVALRYGLLNPNVELFFLCGSQGSGKTLLSYVAAIDLVLYYDKELRAQRGMNKEKKVGFFDKIILLKPTEIFGGKRRDVGALPGDLYQKLKPHLGSYIDAHKESCLSECMPFEELLLHPKFENDFGGPRSKEFKDIKIKNLAHLPANSEVIEMTYSGHVRGRSFRNTLILIDEAQNFTPYELKTIIERTGEGCKVIVMGDPAQVDNPFCSREINGLTHSIKHYIDKPYSALVTLSRNYRSQMSADAKSWRVFSQ